MRCKLICLISSLLIITGQAGAAELCGKALQGEVLVGRAKGAAEIVLNNTITPVDETGLFLLAFGRDELPNPQLTIRDKNNTTSYSLNVGATAWDVQNVNGIPPRKVTPSDSDLRDIDFEQKVVRTALATQTKTPYWQTGFIMPVEGRTSGQFGGQRIMNGIKKDPHAGMDIAAKTGTPVQASAGGIVTLAQPNLFYSGNVVIIDHGYGLHTIYAHLQEMKVKRGDEVKQGDIIGLVGQTGRANGPHLHWGASVNGVKFNPPSLLNINTINDFCFNL